MVWPWSVGSGRGLVPASRDQDAAGVAGADSAQAGTEDHAQRSGADGTNQGDDRDLALVGRGLPQGVGAAARQGDPGLQAVLRLRREANLLSPSRSFKL